METIEQRAERLMAQGAEEGQQEDRLPAWRPMDDDDQPNPLVGKLKCFKEGRTEYGPARIAEVQELSGKAWNVWLFHATLRHGIEDANPQPGALLWLRCDGKKPVKSQPGHTYYAYKVVVEQNTPVQAPLGDDFAPAKEEPKQQHDDIPF